MITTTANDQNTESTSNPEGKIDAVATVKLDDVTGGGWWGAPWAAPRWAYGPAMYGPGPGRGYGPYPEGAMEKWYQARAARFGRWGWGW